jgi:diguanylate cyclase (GGDEF)-like protein
MTKDLEIRNMYPSTELLFFVLVAILALVLHFRANRQVRRLLVSEAKAKQAAAHDALSGLPNRFYFNELIDAELLRCTRTNRKCALFYLDLDRFKEVNDTFGHDAGDRLLFAVTERISTILRGSDRMARLGGDEFAILQTEVNDPRDCQILAQRILDAMYKPFDLIGQSTYAGVSIGIALYPEDATERTDLMRFADIALYRAKRDGSNRFAFFEKGMGDELRLRKTFEDDLRAAISADELVLLYQPIMSSDGRHMVGVEALARWRHPNRGLLSPESFIGIAEERGLIQPLGEWVLRRACADAVHWPNLRIAVNVSAIQFRHKEFVQLVEKTLAETGLDPQRLELELTESVVLGDADQAEEAIFELRSRGIRMAIDDFGTGYSSLIYLRRFAFDKIKIDRSFVQTLEASGEGPIIVQSIAHLGSALGLTVTAEGVETLEQQVLLQAIGCDELQGFFFSAPLTAKELAAKLAAEQAQENTETIARSSAAA